MNRSSRRAARPWGLIGMLGLVVTIESGVARRELDLIGDEMMVAWRVSAREATREAKDAEVLCLGDSLVKLGVLPRVLEAHLGRPSYNLAAPGAQAAASYYLLRRTLAAGARPKALIVDFHSNNLTSPPRATVSFWPELLGAWEALDLGWHAHDHRLLTSTALGLVLPSVRRRDDLRDEIRTALKGERRPRREVVAACLRTLRDHAGATPQPKRPPRLDDAPPVERPRHWEPYPVNADYVRRFLDLATSERIPVFWLLPPLSPARQSRYERRGVDEGYTRFVRAMQARYSNVVVLDGRRSGYQQDAFIDPTHLHEQGASELSAALAAVIGLHAAGNAPGQRWVDLPPYRGQPSPLPGEQTTRSALLPQAGRALR